MFERLPQKHESHSTEPLSDNSTFVLQWPEATREQVVEFLVREHYIHLFRLAKISVDDVVLAGKVARAAISEAVDRRAEFQGQVSSKAWLYGLWFSQVKKRISWRSRPNSTLLSLLHHEENLSIKEIAFVLQASVQHVRRELDSLTAQDIILPPLEIFPTEQIPQISDAILKKEAHDPKKGWKGSELAWLSLALIAVFLLFVQYRVSGFADDGQSLFPSPTPPPPPTPTPVTGIPLLEFTAPADSRPYSLHPPRLSADGKVVVFASTDTSFALPYPEADTNRQQDIFIFDNRESLFFYERLNVSSSGEQANGWSYAPDISADGRWVVFSSNASNLVERDKELCQLARSIADNCFDIFLVDRENDTIQRISQGMNGLEADGHSYLPSISANGRYIIYWSGASNLVTNDPRVCNTYIGSQSCLDVFVYDRELGQTDFIPIGGSPLTADRLQSVQISVDGRVVLIEIHKDDANAGLASGVQFSEDFFIYHRQTHTFIPVASTTTGNPANAQVLNASMTPDGRFVAFTTAASNLVPGDTNNRIDVFVHDMQTGIIERVSISSNGIEGNRHSGITRQSLGGLADKVGISSDGRFVTFVSYAENLDNKPVFCTPPPTLLICNHLYRHDRQTGETHIVVSAMGDINLIAFPSISNDGGTTTYLRERGGCETACTEIFLMNLANNEDRLISRTDVPSLPPPLPWSGQTMLADLDVSATGLAFSPGGDLLAGADRNGRIHLWLADSGQEVYALDPQASYITKLLFSPLVGNLDGQPTGQYILASGDSSGGVQLWQVSPSLGTWRFTLDHHPGFIQDLDFSPDGKFLLASHWEGIWIWELQPTSAYLMERLTIGSVETVAFHPDGDVVAVAHEDGTAWIMSVPEWQIIARIQDSWRIQTLAWKADLLATGNNEGQVSIWKLNFPSEGFLSHRPPGITLLKQFQHSDAVHELTFSRDGDYLAVTIKDNGVWVWNLLHNYPTQITFGWIDTANAVAFSPDNQWIAVAGQSGEIMINSRTAPITTLPPETQTPNVRYFKVLPHNEYVEQQILMVEDGETYDPTIPLATRYSISTREFSPLTGQYIRVPDVLPPEAAFLGQRNNGPRIVSLYHDLPISEYQTVEIVFYVPTGFGDTPMNAGDFSDSRVGANAQVEVVSLGTPENPVYAEFVQGGWAYFLDQAPNLTTENLWVTVDWSVRWTDDPVWMTLRWQGTNALFEIAAIPKENIEYNEDTPLLTFEDLRAIANPIIELDR